MLGELVSPHADETPAQVHIGARTPRRRTTLDPPHRLVTVTSREIDVWVVSPSGRLGDRRIAVIVQLEMTALRALGRDDAPAPAHRRHRERDPARKRSEP